MRIAQYQWRPDRGWEGELPDAGTADLVLLFGSTAALRGDGVAEVVQRLPQAVHFGCSTAGEIRGESVADGTLVATVVDLEHSRATGHMVTLDQAGSSHGAGVELARSIEPEGLTHVLVLSDGIHVNGSDLTRGLVENLPRHVKVTGGLAGDGGDFAETLVLLGDRIESGAIAVLALYGDRLHVGYASLGGWDPFGPERLVTRAAGNVLYELDGKSALQLYKEYLGEHARELPASALRYPLALRSELDATPVVRTVLAVDEGEQSMTFAGDVPEGTYTRLMKANFDRLVDGAAGAALAGNVAGNGGGPELALLISCVGRKMVLGQRVDDEVEAVRQVLGPAAAIGGFYSYGEICPFSPTGVSELHNQTMTITTLVEV